MPPVHVLVKPVSSACDLRCEYCFYRDVATNRKKAFQGMLSLERMDEVLRSAMKYAEGECTILFQGGEPTLAGLDFYRGVVALGEKYIRSGVRLSYAIQTNGTQLDRVWAEFFAQHQFLVGLSLDGPADIHDRNRITTVGKNTFNQVMRAASLLKRSGADFNVLCVVTGPNARAAEKIYRFYRRHDFNYFQFIPCLEPLDQEAGERRPWHLSVGEYGRFLVRIFDLWWEDLCRGQYVSIRHLDNWLGMLLGYPPESCGMSGRCSIQFVVEGDGGVYPCDFYALDHLRLGTVGRENFGEMAACPAAQRFVEESLERPAECAECRYYPLCRNGCRRDRVVGPDGKLGRTRYCEAHRTFFSQRLPQLEQAAAWLARSIR